MALLAVSASLLSRMLAPALPGTVSGIDRWIVLTGRLAGIVSANFFLAAALVMVWLSLAVLVESRSSTPVRLMALPVSFTVTLVALVSVLSQVHPRWLLWAGALVGLFAVAVVPGALRASRTRAMGLSFAITGAIALTDAAARWLALRAGTQALVGWFRGAQVLATVALALELVALLVLALWVIGRRPRVAVLGALTVSLCAVVLTTLGARGTQVDASFLEVLIARVFGELTRHPRPLVPVAVVHAMEVSRHVLVVAALLVPGRSVSVAVAMALAALAMGNTDLPACAVMLTLAALAGSLAIVGERSSASRPPSRPRDPSPPALAFASEADAAEPPGPQQDAALADTP